MRRILFNPVPWRVWLHQDGQVHTVDVVVTSRREAILVGIDRFRSKGILTGIPQRVTAMPFSWYEEITHA